MSRLEDLIHEFCPDGVGYKNLGDVCDIVTDYTAAGSFADIAKNVHYMSDGGYAQLIRTTDLKSTFKNTDRFVYVDEKAFKYLRRVNLNEESLILPNIGNCGEVYYITPDIFPSELNVLGPNAILLRSHTSNMRYLYYVFLAKEFQKKLSRIVSPTGQTKFNKTDLKKVSIPIPPLEVQNEIVRILDNFTELTAELNAELTARKRQYEFYREKLFESIENACYIKTKNLKIESFWLMPATPCYLDKGVPYITSKNLKNNSIDFNDVKYISEEDYHNISANRQIKSNDMLITMIGTIGEAAFVNEFINFYGQNMYLLRLDETKINRQYYYYYFTMPSIKKNLIYKKNESSQGYIKAGSIENLEIPVPSFRDQEYIVSILDQFDSLCNNLSKGLPAEIEARQRQYEYYRDKLLTFKDKTA